MPRSKVELFPATQGSPFLPWQTDEAARVLRLSRICPGR